MSPRSLCAFAVVAAGLLAITGVFVGWEQPTPTAVSFLQGWEPEVGKLRNGELQTYTAQARNGRVENGRLVLEAHKEANGYTSASWRSTQWWTYGRFAIRAKLPQGRGLWSSLWLVGDESAAGRWPKCGEIDIVEVVGYTPNTIFASAHTSARNHIKKNHPARSVVADGGWHTYGLIWTPDYLAWSLDGREYFRWNREDPWPFDRPHQLILSLAVGGSWGGEKGVDDGVFPARMEVESIRVD